MKTDYLKILKAFVSKDELKPALMGVFYDANVGINFDYMSGVASAFKQGCAPHFRLNIGSNISPLLMYPYMFDEMHSTKTTILIMPVRI